MADRDRLVGQARLGELRDRQLLGQIDQRQRIAAGGPGDLGGGQGIDRGVRERALSSATAAAGSSPVSGSVGIPATRTSSAGSSRMANRIATDSACSRRATKASTSSDSASSQCASSTRADQRRVLTGFGEQPQHAQSRRGTDPAAVRLDGSGGDQQRLLMPFGQGRQVVGQGQHEPLQAGEGEWRTRPRTRPAGRRWTPAGRLATSCSSAVLPIPGRRGSACDPLIPLRALLINASANNTWPEGSL